MVRVSCLMSMEDTKALGRTGLKASVGDPGRNFQGQHSRGVGRGVQQANLEVEGMLPTLETGSKGGQEAESLICTFFFTPRHPQVSPCSSPPHQGQNIENFANILKGILAKEPPAPPTAMTCVPCSELSRQRWEEEGD